MKLLTVAVPCYNSSAYMLSALDSAAEGGSDLEIIIVDDGSTDSTPQVADEWAGRHPGIAKVIHQSNRGHGGALNAALAEAQGIWFRVLDSDDRLDGPSLHRLLELLRAHSSPEQQPDLVVHDYVYDHADEKAVYGVSYERQFPDGQPVSWAQAHAFPPHKQFMIHSLIYRTQLLRDHGLQLPEHIFYEDNVYIYQPLPWTKRVLYCHVPLYGYLTGRKDQSVNEQVIISRLEQVTEMAVRMITSYSLAELKAQPKTLRNYMLNNACGQLTTTCSLQFIEGTERGKALNREMWQRIHDFDPALYKALRRNPLGWATLHPRLLVFGYRLVRRHIRF